MSKNSPSWLCCQIGAREHYAIPRALYQAGQLAHLITDAWVLPQSPLNRLPKPFGANLRERFHPDLTQAPVRAFTNSLLTFEITQRIQKALAWERMIARNQWFQKQAILGLKSISSQINRPTLFAYSYAALDLFRYAKSQGWQTILGQIDPGLVEEQLVIKEYAKHPILKFRNQLTPPSYWTNWQQECSLADRIIVNSDWSSQALQQVGIPKEKIDVIPLAYQPPPEADDFVRTYPPAFSPERPLRVLFLGQVVLRKGIAALLEAAELLRDRPIEFWLVGSQGIPIPQEYHPHVKWIGAVPRSATAKYYQSADVFLFPTLSDGFGLTQLEAQAWRLPIIASRYCGNVVKNRVNGMILPEVTGKAIAEALLLSLHRPEELELFSQQSISLSGFNLLQLQHNLQNLSLEMV
jgi:glycosyltransferase involved in cell wall biosynthesis